MALNRDDDVLIKIEADTKQFLAEMAVLKQALSGNLEASLNAFKDKILNSTKAAESGFLGLNSTAAKTGLVIGGATVVAVAAAASIFKLAESAAKFADGFVDLSVKTNLSAETLSVLKFNTEQTDVSFGTISQSLVIFQKNMTSAAEGNAKLAERFKFLKVDLTQGVEPAFLQTLEAMSKLTDGNQKLKLATDVFGRSGAAILVLLDQMGGDFKKAYAEAERLGLVISTKDARAADEFNDRLKALEKTTQGFTYALGKSLLPELTNMLKSITDIVGKVNQLTAAIGGLQGIASKVIKLSFEITGIPGIARFLNGPPTTLYDERAGPLLTPPKTTSDVDDFSKGGKGSRGAKAKQDITELQQLIRLAQVEEDKAKRLLDGSQEKLEEYLNARRRTIELQRREAASELPRERAAVLAELHEKELGETKDYYKELGDIKAKYLADEYKDFVREQELRQQEEDAYDRFINTLSDLDLRRERADLESHRTDLERATKAGAPEGSLRVRAIQVEQEAIELELKQLEINHQRELAQADKEFTDREQRMAVEKKLDEAYLAEKTDFLQRLSNISAELQKAQAGNNPLSVNSLFGDRFATILKLNEGNIFKSITQSGSEMFDTLSKKAGNFGSIAGGAVASFTEGLGQMFAALVLGGETGPAALRKLTAAVLAQVAQQSAVKAIYELAEGFALLFWDPGHAAAHFQAAALYGAAAAAAGFAARAIAPASAGGSQGQTAGSQNNGPRVFNQDTRPGTVQIILRVEEGIVAQKMANDYANNGVTRQIVRNDLGANNL